MIGRRKAVMTTAAWLVVDRTIAASDLSVCGAENPILSMLTWDVSFLGNV